MGLKTLFINSSSSVSVSINICRLLSVYKKSNIFSFLIFSVFLSRTSFGVIYLVSVSLIPLPLFYLIFGRYALAYAANLAVFYSFIYHLRNLTVGFFNG